MTRSFIEGDIVRVKKTDQVATLEEVNDRALTPEWADEYWALASTEGGYNNVELDSPDEIELVMSAEDASKRKLPTAAQIAVELNLTSGGWNNSVDIHSTETDGDSVWCYGRTDDGLDVAFKVTVSEVFEGGDY